MSRASTRLPAEARRAIAGMTRLANGSVQVKLHGKVRALEMLAKHLGMYEIRREPTSRVGDVSVLTDEELVEIIREHREAVAGGLGDDVEQSSAPHR